MSKASAPGDKTKKKDLEYFLLHPAIEKRSGYTQAVRIGNTVKIGGVVSIDDKGKVTGEGDFLQQMKNCYANIGKVLEHYNCTFDNVYYENLYTTSMSELHKHAAYRKNIYKKQFPSGCWLGVNELGQPQMLIEIEVEACIVVKD